MSKEAISRARDPAGIGKWSHLPKRHTNRLRSSASQEQCRAQAMELRLLDRCTKLRYAQLGAAEWQVLARKNREPALASQLHQPCTQDPRIPVSLPYGHAPAPCCNVIP